MQYMMKEFKGFFVVSDPARVESACIGIREKIFQKQNVPTHFMIEGVRVPILRNKETARNLLNRKNRPQ